MQIDNFLERYQDEIAPADRAKIRRIAADAIESGNMPKKLPCPEDLYWPLIRAINEERYTRKCAGQKYTAKDARDAMPSAGKSEPSKLYNVVRL